MSLFSGQRAWAVQRLSALVLLAYAAGALLRLAFGPAPTYAAWQAWAAKPLGMSLLLILAGAVIVHAWVGLRDVALDYLRPTGLRLAVLGIAGTGFLALGAWILALLASHAISHPAL